MFQIIVLEKDSHESRQWQPVLRTGCIALAKPAQRQSQKEGERCDFENLQKKSKFVHPIVTTSSSGCYSLPDLGVCLVTLCLLAQPVMSSLAGALEEPVRYNHSYSSALSSAHDHDADMKMEVKEEPNPVLEQAAMHRDGHGGGDEPMDDLFGQEAEMDEPRQVKSETCVFMLPRNTIPCAHTLRIQEPCRYTC